MNRVLTIFGTRPEAIKLAPLISALRAAPGDLHPLVCVTAQHRGLLDQVLDVFSLRPDFDLDLMTPGQTLIQSCSRILAALEPVFEQSKPAFVLVQGDTTTTFAGALAAFYRGIPCGHVEAGLRTGDLLQPFPEEANRLLTSRIATLHFAATDWAAQNLLREGVPAETVSVTGNTGVDAVLDVARRLDEGSLTAPLSPQWPDGKRMVLVTAHRRESFGPGFERICDALAMLARRPDLHLIYPVHPNPNVRDTVNRRLAGLSNLTLLDPLDYLSFVNLMRRAHFLITDSGGVQEEGPSLGKPILVLREKTERPEAVHAGTVRLVGTSPERILAESQLLLDDPAEYERRSRVHNPYGDGRASARIVELIGSFCNRLRVH
ncbi:MAG: UDP-N-acetylglucosamine 2-epimerase (non-hydrolyzing) [Bryobacterales bacterium]|nr:UDP-N-acetylglucosamine 2-epimerase (non-hydrolyzing) [Bryobacterales bacterium]